MTPWEYRAAADELHGVPFLVTTTRDAVPEQVAEAQALAAEYGQHYVSREIGALPNVLAYGLQQGWVRPEYPAVLVVRRRDYAVWQPEGPELLYHPGMAYRRIECLAEGLSDPMVEAMALREGDTVLDCTAGLCSDAAVAAHVVGERGLVCAVESSLPVFLTVRKGLAVYETGQEHVDAALRRIRLVAARAEVLLRMLPTASWDVVYFDPMFRQPVLESAGIAPLRALADPTPLRTEVLAEAARVARRCVVVKDRLTGPWFNHPGFSRRVGRRKRRIGYAVLEGEERRRAMEGAWV